MHARYQPYYSKRPVRPYVLSVAPAEDDPGAWEVIQELPRTHRRLRPGEVEVSAGGGGLGFRIDRCTGATSRMFFAR
ncbi:MAG TPA: hypothetical protein VFW19_14645 [Allosphingosinicella sp.]|nr:hypothetical protein [Allosphingosinicella sp.]